MVKTLKEKTAKGLFWGGISNGLQQVLGVVIGIVLLNILTPDDYGMVGLLAIFTGIASTIQESGFTAALTNRPVFKSEDYNSVFWFNIITGSVLYLLLFFSAPFIAEFYNEPQLVRIARILFLSIIIGSFSIAQNAILFRKLLVKERAKIDITSTIMAGIVGISLAFKGYGHWALVLQTLTASTVGTLLKWYYSTWRPNFKIDFTPTKEMFGFGIKLQLSNILLQIQANIYSILLGKFYTKADVGYYAQGTKWSGMGIQVINGMIYNVAQPIFTPIINDQDRLVNAIRKMIRFTAFIAFPFMLGLAFVGNEFISLISVKWLPCVPILQIYCIWGAVAPISMIYSQIAVSLGKSGIFFWNNLFLALVQILVTILSYPFGIYWIAVSNVTVNFIYLTIWHIYISNKIPLKFVQVLHDCLPYLIVTLGIFGSIHLGLSYWEINNTILKFSIKIILSPILYLIILWLTKSKILLDILALIKNKMQ